MCRILAYASRVPVGLSDLLGAGDLAAFTRLAARHADGWGFAWADDTGVRTFRSPDAAHLSPRFAELSHRRRTDLGLAHVRRRTHGATSEVNTHPFTDGTAAFVHNGTIHGAEALDERIPDDLAALRAGSTDSERYALATFAEARRSGPAAGLAATAAHIAATLDHSSANAALITDDLLVAVSRYRPEAEAAETEPEYYHLRYRVTPDAVVLASSGWGSGWRTLGNGELLVVHRRTLAVEVHAIDTLVPA